MKTNRIDKMNEIAKAIDEKTSKIESLLHEMLNSSITLKGLVPAIVSYSKQIENLAKDYQNEFDENKFEILREVYISPVCRKNNISIDKMRNAFYSREYLDFVVEFNLTVNAKSLEQYITEELLKSSDLV